MKSTQDQEQDKTGANADGRPAQPLRRRVRIPRRGVASSNPIGEWKKRQDREGNRAEACWRNPVSRIHRGLVGKVDVKSFLVPVLITIEQTIRQTLAGDVQSLREGFAGRLG